jgi:hypothetical protein
LTPRKPRRVSERRNSIQERRDKKVVPIDTRSEHGSHYVEYRVMLRIADGVGAGADSSVICELERFT